MGGERKRRYAGGWNTHDMTQMQSQRPAGARQHVLEIRLEGKLVSTNFYRENSMHHGTIEG